jgi:transposase
MATQMPPVLLGADVSQGWLDIHQVGEDAVERIANERRAIDAFLKRFPAGAIAVEATNTYHELLVERALKRGLVVYLVSGYQIKHYGHALGQRMRTDEIDARLISRFLAREIDQLKPFEPKPPQHVLLWTLLKRRAKVTQTRQQLRQSFSGIKELRSNTQQIQKTFARVLKDLDRRAAQLVLALGWQEEVKRVQGIPGVGLLNAQALVAAYHSGSFVHHDPFIAYLGLDVRAKDSGKFRGQRKLTKHGDGEYRRLLYCAAVTACRMPGYFGERYQGLLARGLTKTAAHVVIARKLAIIGFNLLRKGAKFDPAQLIPADKRGEASRADQPTAKPPSSGLDPTSTPTNQETVASQQTRLTV